MSNVNALNRMGPVQKLTTLATTLLAANLPGNTQAEKAAPPAETAKQAVVQEATDKRKKRFKCKETDN